MTVLPAVVSVFGDRVREGRAGRSDRLVRALGGFVTRRYRPILALTGFAVVVLSLSVSRLEINDRYIEYFAESMPIRQGSDFALEHLNGAGIFAATFSIEAGESQGVSDPE